MNQFLFLYPVSVYFDIEINNHSYGKKEGKAAYRQKYIELLNRCIDVRYRQKGFVINFAVFNGCPVSEVVKVYPLDKIIEIGLNFGGFLKKQPSGEYLYPDSDYILAQLGQIEQLVIAGFHMWDCVEKVAKRAYEKGLNVIVDEDLTDFFCGRIDYSEFTVEKYPGLNFRKILGPTHCLEDFLKARKIRPWLWQNY